MMRVRRMPDPIPAGRHAVPGVSDTGEVETTCGHRSFSGWAWLIYDGDTPTGDLICGACRWDTRGMTRYGLAVDVDPPGDAGGEAPPVEVPGQLTLGEAP